MSLPAEEYWTPPPEELPLCTWSICGNGEAIEGQTFWLRPGRNHCAGVNCSKDECCFLNDYSVNPDVRVCWALFFTTIGLAIITFGCLFLLFSNYTSNGEDLPHFEDVPKRLCSLWCKVCAEFCGCIGAAVAPEDPEDPEYEDPKPSLESPVSLVNRSSSPPPVAAWGDRPPGDYVELREERRGLSASPDLPLPQLPPRPERPEPAEEASTHWVCNICLEPNTNARSFCNNCGRPRPYEALHRAQPKAKASPVGLREQRRSPSREGAVARRSGSPGMAQSRSQHSDQEDRSAFTNRFGERKSLPDRLPGSSPRGGVSPSPERSSFAQRRVRSHSPPPQATRFNPLGTESAGHPAALRSPRPDTRPVCKYGASCYRKNPQHFIEFRHPGHELDPDLDVESSATEEEV